MSKYLRHQAVITRNSDAPSGENSWLGEMQKHLLEKEAVQPRSVDQSLFHQINSIMNGKSKYPSVEAAVEDMKARSGLTAYLEREDLSKVSKDETEGEHKKVASDQNELKGLPIVIQKCPQVKKTLENYINDTRGNLPISAILEKIRSIHKNDVSDARDWEDSNLLRFISRENLKAKHNNPSNFQTYENLGKKDLGADEDIDPSNSDAFHALMPARV